MESTTSASHLVRLLGTRNRDCADERSSRSLASTTTSATSPAARPSETLAGRCWASFRLSRMTASGQEDCGCASGSHGSGIAGRGHFSRPPACAAWPARRVPPNSRAPSPLLGRPPRGAAPRVAALRATARPHGTWRQVNHVEMGTFEWVNWFNTERIHEAIDDLTPVEAESSATLTTPPSPRPDDSPNRVSGHPRATHGASCFADAQCARPLASPSMPFRTCSTSRCCESRARTDTVEWPAGPHSMPSCVQKPSCRCSRVTAGARTRIPDPNCDYRWACNAALDQPSGASARDIQFGSRLTILSSRSAKRTVSAANVGSS